MAVDEAQERRQQLPLFFQFARADSCGDHLGVAARQPDGPLKFLVLPFRFGLRLAADAEECPAALAARNLPRDIGVESMYCREPDSRSSTMLTAPSGSAKRGIRLNDVLIMIWMNVDM